jgi:hypothetical protein
MQSFTPSQYGGEDHFAHLEGASGYSFNPSSSSDLADDTSSLHSSSTTTTNHHHHQIPPHQQGQILDGDREDLEVLDFDQLSLNHSHSHSNSHQSGGGGGVDEGQVANLYEEDFEGMLDDLNRELPEHACS